MVRASLEYQITVTQMTGVPADPVDPPDPPQTDPEVEWAVTTSSVSQNGPLVQVLGEVRGNNGELYTQHTEEIVVPFTVTGTADLNEDFVLRSSNSPSAPALAENRWYLTFPPGVSQVAVWIDPLNNPVVTGDRTIGLTLVSSSAYATLTGATLGADVLHTCTVVDTDTNPAIQFLEPQSSILEDVGLYQVPVRISEYTGNEEVDYSVADGAAQAGVDYNLIGTGAGQTLQFTQSDTQYIRFEIIDRAGVQTPAIRDFTITLSNPTGGPPAPVVPASGSTHTVYIGDTDAPDYFPEPSWAGVNPSSVPEGAGTLGLIVEAVAGTVGATFTVVQAGGTAQPGVDFVIEDPTVVFGAGQVFFVFNVEFLDNDVVGNRTLQLQLLPVTAGATVGTNDVLQITILDNDSAVTGVDGDRTDYQGNELFPDRQPFDESDPDIDLYQDGVMVVTADGHSGPLTWYPVETNRSVIALALVRAGAIWQARYTPPATMGDENPPIKIRCWNGRLGAGGGSWPTPSSAGAVGATDDIIGRRDATGSIGINERTIGKNSGAYDVAAAWENQNDVYRGGLTNQSFPVVRDVVFYSSRGIAEGPTEVVSHFHQLEDYYVDNFRWERIRFGNADSGSTIDSHYHAGATSNGVNSAGGRLKMYDCVMRGYDTLEPYLGGFGQVVGGTITSGENQYRAKWSMKADARMAYDIRRREGLPETTTWYTFQDAYEHPIYGNRLTGPEQYSAIGTTYNPALGVTSYPSLLLINVNHDPDNNYQRTFYQMLQGPFLNRNAAIPSIYVGPRSNGDVVIMRVVSKNNGLYQDNVSQGAGGGQAFTIWAQKGRVYLKDCLVTNDTSIQSIQGGLGVFPNTSGDGTFVYESGGQKYICEEVVVDGLTVEGWRQRAPLILRGVETVRLVKFNFSGIVGYATAQFNELGAMDGGKHRITGVQGPPGAITTATFDITDLTTPNGDPYPTSEPFWDYPGWRVGGGLRLLDGYWENWRLDPSNTVQTPSAGALPAGFTGSTIDPASPNDLTEEAFINAYPDIVGEQSTNRTTGQIDDIFWPLGTPGPGNVPTPPAPRWAGTTNGALSAIYLGEGQSTTGAAATAESDTIWMDYGGGSECEVIAVWTVTSSTSATSSEYTIAFGDRDEPEFDNTVVESPAGTFTLTQDNYTPEADPDGAWYPPVAKYVYDTYDKGTSYRWYWGTPLKFTALSGGSYPGGGGNHELTLTLTSGTWDYPRGGGHTALSLGTPSTATVYLIPADEFPEMTFNQSTWDVELSAGLNTLYLGTSSLPVQVTRTAYTGNAESIKLISTFEPAITIYRDSTGTSAANAGEVTVNQPLTWLADEALPSVSGSHDGRMKLTFAAGEFEVGDRITLFMHSSAGGSGLELENVQPMPVPPSGAGQQALTITFISSATDS